MKTIYFLLATASLWAAAVTADILLPESVIDVLEHGIHAENRDRILDEVQKLEERLRVSPYDRKVTKALAMIFLDGLREPSRAVPYLERIVDDAPESVSWNYCLGRAYKESGRVAEAEMIFAKVTALQPENAWAWYELGTLFSDTGRSSEAIEAYGSALIGSGGNVTILLSLLREFWRAGRIPEAVEVAQKILEQDGSNQEARRVVEWQQSGGKAENDAQRLSGRSRDDHWEPQKPNGVADRALNDAYRTGSISSFEHAARLLSLELGRSQNNVGKRKTLAFLYLDKLHSPQRALPHLKVIVRRFPLEGGWWEMLARAQSETGDLRGAVESYRSAIEHSGRNVWLFYHLARVQQNLGVRSEAIRSFEKALQLDPLNIFVRRELARCYFHEGRMKEAEELAHDLVVEGVDDAGVHAILGDLERLKLHFSAAKAEYNEALSLERGNQIAMDGIREIDRLSRIELGVVCYAFRDTEGFSQSGVFTRASVPGDGRLSGWYVANERFFAQSCLPTVKRFEGSLGADYWLFPNWKLSGGGSVFSSEARGSKGGGSIALHYLPSKNMDSWVMQQVGEPVNDSYSTAREVLSQSILSAGINLCTNRQFVFRSSGSWANYADGNVRKRFLIGAGWRAPWVGKPELRLEGEWVDYAFQAVSYSSPAGYTRVRPVLDWGSRLNDWLRVELHGELCYVCDLTAWGTGLTAGFRVNKGDSLDVGWCWMNYEVPGGQSTWSGSGLKLDLNWRF